MTNEKKSLSTSLIYFFGALGGLLFGYDTGVISGAILFIKKQFGLMATRMGSVSGFAGSYHRSSYYWTFIR